MSSDFDPWTTEYHVDGELPWQEPEGAYEVPLRIGEGFYDYLTTKRRYRVVDIWYSTDKHGAFDRGRHVFLEDVAGTDDDRLGLAVPGYFESEGE